MTSPPLNMIDNRSLQGRGELYEIIDVNLDKILTSWKISLFSFEWLTPQGQVRSIHKLPETERLKYEAVLALYESGGALERPILGIGIMDNVEIGSRRDVLLTLKNQGVATLSVHIPSKSREYFIPFKA